MPQSASGVVVSGSVVVMGMATVRSADADLVVPVSMSCWVRAAMSMPSPEDGATYWGLAPAAPVAEPSIVQPALTACVSIGPMAAMRSS